MSNIKITGVETSLEQDKNLNKLENAFNTTITDLQERWNSNESNKKSKSYQKTKDQLIGEMRQAGKSINVFKALDEYAWNTGDTKFAVQMRGSKFKGIEGTLVETLKDSKTKRNHNYGQISNEVFFGKRRTLKSAGGLTVSADATASETFTNNIVEYVIDEPVVKDFIQTIPISTNTIRLIKDVPGSTDMTFAGRAEGAAFTRVDSKTDQDTRTIKSVGAYYAYPEELMLDGDRAHFLPYLAMRVREEFDLQIEKWTISGTGANNTPTGFLGEAAASLLTLPALTNKVVVANNLGTLQTGVSDVEFVDFLNDMIRQVLVASKRMPNLIIMHPTEYYRILKLKNSDNMYQHLFNQVNAPLGNNIPTLWGVPVVQSQTLPDNHLVVMNTVSTAIYTNAGGVRVEEGLIDDQFLENMRTVKIDFYFNTFTRRLNSINRIKVR